jgi:hypothetical protein
LINKLTNHEIIWRGLQERKANRKGEIEQDHYGFEIALMTPKKLPSGMTSEY